MISRDTKLFKSIRWAYQPIKQSAYLAREWSASRSRERVIAEYLNRDGFKGLQIGSGPQYRHGWLNSDVVGTPGIDVALDIERPLPFDNCVLDAIYGSEVIEHISRERVAPFLKEAHRVLKVGGVLRLSTPDLRAICEIYLGINESSSLSEIETTWLEQEFSPDYWLNAMFRNWGHQWLWDFESISALMIACGFSKIERVQPQVTISAFVELRDQETRYGVPPPPHCWPQSMIIEAQT